MVSKKSDVDMRRFRSLTDTFRKIDRILTSDLNLAVRFPNPLDRDEQALAAAGTSAWSQYPDIVINPSAFEDFRNSETLVGLLGVNYHELAHIIYSPGIVWKQDNILPESTGVRMAYHLLEDQRIESYFTAKYQPAGKYFTQMVVNVIINGPQAHWESAFLLLYGRTYLPLEIRDEFEARYAHPEKIERAKELIKQYKKFRKYHFDHQPAKVVGVLREFADLMREDQADNPEMFSDQNQGCASEEHNSGHQNEDEEKEAQREERKRQEKEEKTGEDQSGFWEEDDEEDEDAASASGEGDDESDEEDDSDSAADESTSDSDSGDDDSGDGEDGEGSEGSDSEGSDADGSDDGDEGDEEGESGDGDSDSDDGSEGDPGVEDEGGEGAGGGVSLEGDDYEAPESAFDDDELDGYLEEIVEAVNEDEAVQQEIRNIVSAMNDFNEILPPDVTIQPDRFESPNAVMMSVVEQSQQELRRLYAETEPGWRSDSDSGRLNFGRYMENPEDFDTAFDEWDEGREEDTGIECVMALDMSSSMGSRIPEHATITPASEAMYVIKRSLDEIDAKVTVIGFGADSVASLYDRTEKVGVEVPYFDAQMWGTVVAPALHFARRTLTASTMPNKLFVILTDGGWHYNDPEDDEFDQDAWSNAVTRGQGPEHAADLIDQIPGVRMYVGLGTSGENALCKEHFDVVSVNMQASDVPELVQRAVVAMLNERRR